MSPLYYRYVIARALARHLHRTQVQVSNLLHYEEIASSGRSPSSQRHLLLRRFHDRDELIHFEAGAADQGTVNI